MCQLKNPFFGEGRQGGESKATYETLLKFSKCREEISCLIKMTRKSFSTLGRIFTPVKGRGQDEVAKRGRRQASREGRREVAGGHFQIAQDMVC